MDGALGQTIFVLEQLSMSACVLGVCARQATLDPLSYDHSKPTKSTFANKVFASMFICGI